MKSLFSGQRVFTLQKRLERKEEASESHETVYTSTTHLFVLDYHIFSEFSVQIIPFAVFTSLIL